MCMDNFETIHPVRCYSYSFRLQNNTSRTVFWYVWIETTKVICQMKEVGTIFHTLYAHSVFDILSQKGFKTKKNLQKLLESNQWITLQKFPHWHLQSTIAFEHEIWRHDLSLAHKSMCSQMDLMGRHPQNTPCNQHPTQVKRVKTGVHLTQVIKHLPYG